MTDAPRTVTFGASPQDEAQYRSARLGNRVIGLFLGVPAAALALVACLWALNFAVSLASSWGEAVKLGLIAVAITLAVTGLPVAAAMLSRSYPGEARNAMRLWLAALGFTVLGMVAFVAQLEPQDRKLTAPDYAAIRNAAGVSDVVWRYSDRCRAPENDTQAARCDAYRQAALTAVPADWSPRTLFAISKATDDGPLRRVMVLALGLMAVIGAGLIGRLGVLASSESYRLGSGEASPVPSGIAPLAISAGGEQFEPQSDLFEPWAELNLKEAPGAAVQVTPAYEDYAKICRLNFQEPMGAKQFAQCLQARAMASRGRIAKRKINGVMCYQGWQLASEVISGLQVVGSKTPVARIGYGG